MRAVYREYGDSYINGYADALADMRRWQQTRRQQEYVGQRIEARDMDILGHINTRDKAQALQLRRQMLKILNPELGGTLTYEYGGFKRVINCRTFGEPKIERKSVLYEFSFQLECLNPFWREEDETKEDIASWVAAWHFPCQTRTSWTETAPRAAQRATDSRKNNKT